MTSEDLSKRIGTLALRLYESETERDVVFKGNFGALAAGLRKTKRHRISFSPNGKMGEFMLVTLTDKEAGRAGPVSTLIARLDSGETKIDGRAYDPKRMCFVCRRDKELVWTNMPLENTPRVQLLVFTCSERCILAIRHVSTSLS